MATAGPAVIPKTDADRLTAAEAKLATVPDIQLNDAERKFLLQSVGFSGRGLATMDRIGHGESRWKLRTIRPHTKNSGGGNDIGVFQLNDRYFYPGQAELSLNPTSAAQKAFEISKGGTDFGPWALGPNSYRGTPRTDITETDISEAAARMAGVVADPGRLANLSAAQGLIDLPGVPSIPSPGDIVGAIPGSEQIGRAAGFLAKAGAVLTSGEFWRRAQLIVGGITVVILALVFLFRDTLGGLATKSNPVTAVAGSVAA